MGLYVNPSEVSLRSAMVLDTYVDKSMMIAEINKVVDTDRRYVCVSRARRFGKTMMTSLLAAYYSKKANSRPLLEKLKIARDPNFEQYLNKLNVILIDINVAYNRSNMNEDVVPMFTQEIRDELIEEFPEVDIAQGDDLSLCIYKIYKKTGETFAIFIDEYDVLVRERVPASIFKPYLAFLNAMFKSNIIKPAISLAYLTGILPIVREKIQSKLNVFKEYTMVDSYNLSEFVGFTDEEVKALCESHGMDFEECCRWYDGYRIRGFKLYNPRSVVFAMDGKKYASYWTATSSYEALKNYILMDFKGIRDDVVKMISGGKIDVDVGTYLNTMTDFHCKDDVFAYLIHLGYLAYDEDKEQCYIPNEEVRKEWIRSIRLEDDYAKAMELVVASKELLDLTVEGDEEAVAAALEAAHEELASNLRYNHESGFQCMIRLAYFYANTRYTVVSELPAGKGFADVAYIPYIPNVPAMIVELKRNGSPDSALIQIREKQYFKAFEHYQGDLLFVGVSYDEKTKVHTCKIERFVKE